MGKKDFTTSTDNVFDDFFSQPTEKKKEEPKKEPKEEVKIETSKTPSPTKNKSKKEVVISTNKEEPKEEVKEPMSTPDVKEETKATPKSYNKYCRYNFYLDTDLADFVGNYLWLTRHTSYSHYFNSLIKQDLLKKLNLPAETSNEEMLKKWEEYKKQL